MYYGCCYARLNNYSFAKKRCMVFVANVCVCMYTSTRFIIENIVRFGRREAIVESCGVSWPEHTHNRQKQPSKNTITAGDITLYVIRGYENINVAWSNLIIYSSAIAKIFQYTLKNLVLCGTHISISNKPRANHLRRLLYFYLVG